MLLQLQKGILYGPVNSRRYGKSLGINLSPSRYKLCSFNCVYCHYGWTKKCTTDMRRYEKDLPVLADVVAAVEQAVKSSVEFELITFSGNGEPTLYPAFGELVEAVAWHRDRFRPEAKLALLSNATALGRKQVRESIAKFDLPILKLDAGNAEKFKAVNRPARKVNYAEVVENLTELQDIYIQTVLVDGVPSNITEADLHDYCSVVKRIGPKEIHLYSIDRPVPNTRITLVPPERLLPLAELIKQETGVATRAFFPSHPSTGSG